MYGPRPAAQWRLFIKMATDWQVSEVGDTRTPAAGPGRGRAVQIEWISAWTAHLGFPMLLSVPHLLSREIMMNRRHCAMKKWRFFDRGQQWFHPGEWKAGLSPACLNTGCGNLCACERLRTAAVFYLSFLLFSVVVVGFSCFQLWEVLGQVKKIDLEVANFSLKWCTQRLTLSSRRLHR